MLFLTGVTGTIFWVVVGCAGVCGIHGGLVEVPVEGEILVLFEVCVYVGVVLMCFFLRSGFCC